METLEKYQHAKDLYLAGQHAEAANIYAALAKEGSVDATVFYGWMCEQGIGIPKKENKALELCESAASLGSSEANYWLGRRCGPAVPGW